MLKESIAIALVVMSLLPFVQASDNAKALRWHDACALTVEGKGWTNTANFFDRCPAKAREMVRPPVWELSEDSAGMCVRFVTDASEIAARWVLRKDFSMSHMAASGVSGLDLYVKEKGQWRWVAIGRPCPQPILTNEAVLVCGLRPIRREFALYLPLYNGVKSVAIGVAAAAQFKAAPVRLRKPIVFYGTSILQGGCASRPGMAYPAIIGRHLDWPSINLGFSGNARSEPEVARLLAELEPSVYVLDPLPNMDAAGVNERMEPFVKTLRAAHPKTPIVLVENIAYQDAPFVEARFSSYSRKNAALKAAYERLVKDHVKNLYYITSDGLLGNDGDATVDGTHATDLGFLRMSDKIGPVLKKVLK
jgi:hypothetical protein